MLASEATAESLRYGRKSTLRSKVYATAKRTSLCYGRRPGTYVTKSLALVFGLICIFRDLDDASLKVVYKLAKYINYP
jgi:hypothetical protein